MKSSNQDSNAAALQVAHVMKAMAPNAFETLYDFVTVTDVRNYKDTLWEMMATTIVEGDYSDDKSQRAAYLNIYTELSQLLDFLYNFFDDSLRKASLAGSEKNV